MTDEEIKQECLDVMGLDLGSFYYQLRYECDWLHLKWSNFVILFGTKPERIDLLNSAAPAFFALIQDIMWKDIILHICRLMDPPQSPGKGKDNLTLLGLPQMIDTEARSEVESLLELANSKCEFTRDWRNRHLAHLDRNLALGESAKPLAAASRRDVKDALEAICAVLNVVHSRYTDSEMSCKVPSPNPGDAECLLYVLRDGVDAETARRERWRSGQALPEDLVAPPDI